MQKELIQSNKKIRRLEDSVQSYARILILAVTGLTFLVMLYAWLPAGDDWPTFFRPAVLLMIQGRSPYEANIGFYNPPWALLPLIPIALLPFQLGRLALFLISLGAFAYGARKLTSNLISILLLLTSAPVGFCLLGGNIDWLLMLAFVTPAPFSLILAAIKPQIGGGIAIYWLIVSWQQGGARRVLQNFMPVGLLLFASFLLYGFYPASYSQLSSVSWNAAPFPYLVPIGILFVGAVIRTRTARPVFLSLFFYPVPLCLLRPLTGSAETSWNGLVTQLGSRPG
jgi:hypothetical protein